MLRLLIMIECDQCKEMLTSAPSSSDSYRTDWSEDIYTLESDAEQNGWSVWHSQHVCGVCVMDAMAKQHQASACDISF